MVSFLPHLVIPGLFALAFFRVERKRIWWLAPLVWLPDVDYMVPSAHRAATHSVLIPLAVFAVLVAHWRVRDPRAGFWEYVGRPGAPVNLGLATYFLASHLVLDLFQGGVVLFWPLLDTNYFIGFEILLDTSTNEFTPAAEAGTSEGAPALSPVFPWFSTRDSAYLAFFAVAAAVWGGMRLWRRRHEPAPVTVRRTARLVPSPADD